ncbi:MAG TPA: NYN domain-containing protein [Acidimicrobiales bacterium]|nr:NYN domain-containing protein [Acidimicrobiales bacterium]
MGEPDAAHAACADVPTPLLREALEAVWRKVRTEAAATPPVEAPRAMRPLLTMTRLRGAKAFETVRRAVDADDDLRQRAARAADGASMSRASWLWLARPEGWQAELVALAADRAPREPAAGDDRRLQRRLEAAEAARDRADAERAAALAQLDARTADLRAERRRAEAAEAAVAGAERAAELARRAAHAAEEVAASAERRAALADERRQQAEAACDALLAEAHRLQAQLHRATQRGAEAGHALDTALAGRAATGAAVADAAAAARALGDALARAATSLVQQLPGPLDRAGAPAPAAAAGPPSTGAGVVAPLPGPPAGRPGARPAGRRRRTPVPVPRGVFDDTVEWADRLVRTRGALLLVDGYNVTLQSWPGTTLPEQRRTLVDALGELRARTGVDVHVIFDGHPAEVMPPVPSRPRSLVRTGFSPAGEDADEVLIDLVERADPARPVVVATDDNRVRGLVAERGANVVSVHQLLGLLGRRPRP